jgi:hypothetical protein
MSQTASWILEEMARAVQAERRAEATRYRAAASVRGAHTSPRVRLAKALWSLATLIDGDISTKPRPNRQSAGAF